MWGSRPRWTRPSPKKEAWMPTRAGVPDPDADVPEKYRKVRLERTRKTRRMQPSYVAALVFLMVLFVVVAVVVNAALAR